jgi:hypothetical protein
VTVGLYNPSARVLYNNQTTSDPHTLTTTGHSAPIDLRDVTDVWLAVFSTGTSTGTNPTLDVTLDVQDPAGNWFTGVLALTQLTSAPNFASKSAGLHIASTGSMVLPQYGRVTWTLGGTNPVFPATTVTVIGR